MRKNFTTFCFLALLLLSQLSAPSVPARAQTAAEEISGNLGEAGFRSGLGARDIRLSIALGIGYTLTALGVIFLVLITYAGFLWMTAGGEEEKVSKARTLIRNAVIGLFIILSAFAIEVFIFRALVRSATGDPCYEPLGVSASITVPVTIGGGFISGALCSGAPPSP